MSTPLQRITTEYIATEDRVRLSGQSPSGTVVIWLSRRLLDRCVPVLTDMLGSDRRLHAELVQSFAQQAAAAALTPQTPVQAGADSQSWLAHAIDFAPQADAVQLTFRSAEHSATLQLAQTPLRQWLAILHQAYRRAEWSTSMWPDWMEQQDRAAEPAAAVMH